MHQPKLDHIGYARVSTDEQNTDLQVQSMLQHGIPVENIFTEHYTGKTLKRPVFQFAQKYLRRGDTLVVWKYDRLGRNLPEVARLALKLEEWGVALKSLTEGIDTTTAMGRYMFNNLAAFAQFERDMISERTKAGLKAAKERGTWRPRGATISAEQWAFMLEALRSDPLLSAGRLCKLDGMPRFKGNRPKRTTLNNYMHLLRDGSEYPFKE
jgi:DNA invertase Pin-like site-specific DNA recombinase